jgi:hypothetical protein
MHWDMFALSRMLKLAICSLILLCGCVSITSISETPTETQTETPTEIVPTYTITPSVIATETPTNIPTNTPTLTPTFSLQRNAWGGVGIDPMDLARMARRGELTESEGYAMAVESGFTGTMKEFLILKDSARGD